MLDRPFLSTSLCVRSLPRPLVSICESATPTLLNARNATLLPKVISSISIAMIWFDWLIHMSQRDLLSHVSGWPATGRALRRTCSTNLPGTIYFHNFANADNQDYRPLTSNPPLISTTAGVTQNYRRVFLRCSSLEIDYCIPMEYKHFRKARQAYSCGRSISVSMASRSAILCQTC